ncbi:MAG: SAM-dependent methyltransferase [Parvibaculum sp.]|nr:SAM-dependent methyltransferase [Parvibaculum sp.]
MTALAQHIARLITETGPMPLSHFMALALGHPKHGYYMTRDPLGAQGDFTTSPEISQMFGELVGLWIAETWIAQGSPSPMILAEFGPGRGTLMADALRALRSVPGLLEALEVHFVETSPVLSALQKKNVPNATWHDRFDTLPQGPLYVIANEFFDALPVRQFVRLKQGWCERFVMLGEDSTEDAPKFEPAIMPVPLASLDILAPAHRNAPLNSLAEVSMASAAFTEDIAGRIKTHGGAALIIDYGHVKSAIGDTLQALRAHQFVDPFETPGEADITTHVDFEALVRAAKIGGVEAHGPIEQGTFLKALGIHERSETLKAKATLDQARDIDVAERRLTAREEMGSLFKVLALTPIGAPIPAGFEL